MNENILRILTERPGFIPLKKEEVSPEEAYTDTNSSALKPGYTRTFINYQEKCLRYDCTDDDVVAAQLKLSFELLDTTKRIHFWIKFWSILLLVLLAITILLSLL